MIQSIVRGITQIVGGLVELGDSSLTTGLRLNPPYVLIIGTFLLVTLDLA
jgi:hypothetical protein